MKRSAGVDLQDVASGKRANCEQQTQTTKIVPRPLKIISGGQTGADQAALKAAAAIGVATGGWAPPYFITSVGQNMALKTKYNLQEIEHVKSISAAYVIRSMKNVDNGDVTIAFRTAPSSGTDKTIHYAKTRQWCNWRRSGGSYKPTLVVRNVTDKAKACSEILDFLALHRPKTVNICGHRSDFTAKTHGYTKLVEEILLSALYKTTKTNQ